MYLFDFLNHLKLAPDDSFVCCEDFRPLVPRIDRESRTIELIRAASFMRAREFETAMVEAGLCLGNVGRVSLAIVGRPDEGIEVKPGMIIGHNERRAVIVRSVDQKRNASRKKESPPRLRKQKPKAEIGPGEEI